MCLNPGCCKVLFRSFAVKPDPISPFEKRCFSNKNQEQILNEFHTLKLLFFSCRFSYLNFVFFKVHILLRVSALKKSKISQSVFDFGKTIFFFIIVFFHVEKKRSIGNESFWLFSLLCVFVSFGVAVVWQWLSSRIHHSGLKKPLVVSWKPSNHRYTKNRRYTKKIFFQPKPSVYRKTVGLFFLKTVTIPKPLDGLWILVFCARRCQ